MLGACVTDKRHKGTAHGWQGATRRRGGVVVAPWKAAVMSDLQVSRAIGGRCERGGRREAGGASAAGGGQREARGRRQERW